MPRMRLRLSTVVLSLATAASALAATYWRDASTWYSQDEIDAWMVRAKIELADTDDDLYPHGQAKMLVARHAHPDDNAQPFYWHAIVAGPSDAGPFRPTHETFGWAPTRAVGYDAVNIAVDDLLIDAVAAQYDPYDGMDFDDLDEDPFT